MILGWVNRVGSDGVQPKRLHEGNVSGAGSRVGERVGVLVVAGCRTIAGKVLLISYTLDKEFCAVGLVEKFGTLNDDRIDLTVDRAREYSSSCHSCGYSPESLHVEDGVGRLRLC